MEDYKSNSNKSKEISAPETKEIEHRVTSMVSTSAKRRKKSSLKRIMEFVLQDDTESLKKHIVFDIFIPTAMKSIHDALADSWDALFGIGKRSNGHTSNVTKVSYSKMFDDRREEPRRAYSKPVYDFDEISIPTRAEAEDMLKCLRDIMDTYKVVRVLDYYDCVGMTCKHTDNDYGWYNLDSAYVERGRDGFVIRLPRAVPLDK